MIWTPYRIAVAKRIASEDKYHPSVVRITLSQAANEIERLQAENADLRVLIEQVRRDELMTGLAWDEERELEYEVRQALWAIASVDLTEDHLEEWACGLDERVRAEIARLRERDD